MTIDQLIKELKTLKVECGGDFKVCYDFEMPGGDYFTLDITGVKLLLGYVRIETE
jgi:hypothetical protein|tara:strand:- start:11 stop:175 length:165 start_codon:yes stop_codon:yes gene_type:complete